MSLDLNSLVAVLREPLDNEESRKQVETQLSTWETSTPGFHAMLQDVYLNESIPIDPRYRAVIYLKNCVVRNWRRSSSNAISNDEKQHIRSRLLARINEPRRALASQCTVIVSTIARIDFPRDWPQMFEDVHAMVQQANDQKSVYNAYDILIQVIKILSKVKIGNKKALMQEKASLFVTDAITSYTNLVENWSDRETKELSAVCLKCLCVILVQGFEHVNRHEEAAKVFDYLVVQYKQLTQIRDRDENLAKHLKIMSKMFMRLAEAQPASFVLLNKCTEIAHYSILDMLDFENEGDDDDGEALVVRGLALIKALIKTKHGSNVLPRRGEQDRAEAKLARAKLEEEVFTEPVVKAAVLKLIQRGMVFKQKDFESWGDDPEDFYLEGQRVAWQYQLRATAGTLFGDFVVHFKSIIGEQMAKLVEENLTASSNFVQLEATLYALQQGSTEFVNQLKFDDIFVNKIVPISQIQTSDPTFLIVKRRICRVVSEWVSIDCNDESRKHAFEIFARFLQDDGNDLVVKLETVTAIRFMVDDWLFKPQLIQPYVELYVTNLFQLLDQTSTVDVHSSLLTILSVFIEQLGPFMTDHMKTIMHLLPKSWNMDPLKPIVLQVITNLVCEVGEPVIETAVPVIREVMTNTQHCPLIEDCLPLWLAVLRHCKVSRADLLDLVPLLVDKLYQGSETTEQYLEILQEYILLDAEQVMRTQGMTIFRAFARLFGVMKTNSLPALCSAIDTLFILVPLTQEYCQLFVASDLHRTIMTQAMNEDIEGFVSVKIFGIFARLALSSGDLTWQLMEHNQQVWCGWIDKFERIGDPNEQVLHGLGLTMLLRTKDMALLSQLDRVCEIWVELIGAQVQASSLQDFGSNNDPDPENDPRAAMAKIDPVYTWSLQKEAAVTIQGLSQDPDVGQYVNQHLNSSATNLDELRKTLEMA